MTDTRHQGANWSVGTAPSMDGAQLAVLMDLRDELQKLNRLLACDNFTRIPGDIKAVRRNVATLTRLAKEKT